MVLYIVWEGKEEEKGPLILKRHQCIMEQAVGDFDNVAWKPTRICYCRTTTATLKQCSAGH